MKLFVAGAGPDPDRCRGGRRSPLSPLRGATARRGAQGPVRGAKKKDTTGNRTSDLGK
jgi:hypothetical protein